MTSYIPISLNDALNGRGVSIFDVLNGQGNHLKQTAGNVNYRRLVSANKVSMQYAATSRKCHDASHCLVLVCLNLNLPLKTHKIITITHICCSFNSSPLFNRTST